MDRYLSIILLFFPFGIIFLLCFLSHVFCLFPLLSFRVGFRSLPKKTKSFGKVYLWLLLGLFGWRTTKGYLKTKHCPWKLSFTRSSQIWFNELSSTDLLTGLQFLMEAEKHFRSLVLLVDVCHVIFLFC